MDCAIYYGGDGRRAGQVGCADPGRGRSSSADAFTLLTNQIGLGEDMRIPIEYLGLVVSKYDSGGDTSTSSLEQWQNIGDPRVIGVVPIARNSERQSGPGRPLTYASTSSQAEIMREIAEPCREQSRQTSRFSVIRSSCQRAGARRQRSLKPRRAPDPTRSLWRSWWQPRNPRETLLPQELANSLSTHGLRQPLGVMTTDDFVRVYPDHEAAVGRLSSSSSAATGAWQQPKKRDGHAGGVRDRAADDTAVQGRRVGGDIHRQDLSPWMKQKLFSSW